jgi:imidazolonepropionase-like amidohydrolase
MASLLLLGACAPREKDRIALVGGNVISETGATVLRDAVVVIHQGRIETVTPREGFKIPPTAVEVNVTGSWITPGLIDARVRAERWALGRYLAAGVTAVRDVGGGRDSALALREQASLGTLLAPRIYTTGGVIDGPPAADSAATEVKDPAEARRAVDARAVATVDGLALAPGLTPELFKAAADEAKTLGLRISADLGRTDALTASRLGVTALEGLSGVPQAATGGSTAFDAQYRVSFWRGWTSVEKGWSGLDSATIARVASGLAENGVTVIPTLLLHETYSRLDDPTILNQPDLKTVPDSVITRWNLADLKARAGWDDATLTAFRLSRPRQDLFVREFRAAGGRLAVGSGAGSPMVVPGWSLHAELELLVLIGLTPEDALRAATSGNAQLLGLDSIGVIAPGKAADLLILAGDPQADIRNTRKILRVMVRGRLYAADSLRAN